MSANRVKNRSRKRMMITSGLTTKRVTVDHMLRTSSTQIKKIKELRRTC
uniref:Uncharacterized protein n=1 Tax=Rhizophora mucronata TaxID=61149 RepID=A0A2P2PWG1_RHIMU